MRISDWSSDVCSSDLFPASYSPLCSGCRQWSAAAAHRPPDRQACCDGPDARKLLGWTADGRSGHYRRLERSLRLRKNRSEEHTSELQSLMRISYAVFCLKKKRSIRIQIDEVNTHIK